MPPPRSRPPHPPPDESRPLLDQILSSVRTVADTMPTRDDFDRLSQRMVDLERTVQGHGHKLNDVPQLVERTARLEVTQLETGHRLNRLAEARDEAVRMINHLTAALEGERAARLAASKEASGEATSRLAGVDTRLKALEDGVREKSGERRALLAVGTLLTGLVGWLVRHLTHG